MQQTLFNLHEVILLITVTESLLLALGIIVIPKKRPQSHCLLAGLLTLIASILLATLLVWSSAVQQTSALYSSLLIAILSFGLLAQGPLLYFYMQSLTKHVNFYSAAVALHFSPAVMSVVIILVFDLTLFDWLPHNWPHIANYKHNLILFIWAGFKCLPLAYTVLCCTAEYRLRKQLQDRYSNIPFWELRWAEIILGGFSLHWLWAFVAYWLSGYVGPEVNQQMGKISDYVTAALINVLFGFTLWSGRKALILPDISDHKRDSSIVENSEEKLAAIRHAIDVDSLHLEPHINLERFSEHCGVKPREASTLINKHYEKNFFEIINYYRVQEVKKRLSENRTSTVLDIALASGFNSQSAFQRFFKRFEGITPTQYRRQANSPSKRPAQRVSGNFP
ncbi:AraC family transcriptional regulator [Gilvimarinus sp. SDUM040013]|uniref:AraC family transcriptional regulator n=1 Tax=Gilvimarinus gilvus TaxID=3058038 RepID=A0ABU4RUS1_9GAMM|nr:AraC family transcriptional regulator [Gilvimarinus sp. SDUM040013]MDO3388502.1 AraC family transcriptional regulator [Gilvimarinus sp. SDUM040013]MDX6848626.1 AraC family transcriptional regulator [Gilvimarinus sp. SDUM040013]